ncbi:MAG: hypothetical protein ACLUHG_01600 [Sutterella wadsworthensis]
MKRNETSARGASKHAPVKNAGSRRLRSHRASHYRHDGHRPPARVKDPSSASARSPKFVRSVLRRCRRQDLPAAGLLRLSVVVAVVVLFAQIFCGWSRAASAPHHG